jgi:prophage maintenance system killer protein
LRDKHKEAVDSVVKTVNANYFGVERYPTSIDKAVAYLCLIIKDHPVTDGNKRMAVLWFRVYCNAHELRPNVVSYSLDELAVSIEKADLTMDKLMDVVKRILFKEY